MMQTLQDQALRRLETERRRLEQNLARMDAADMLRPGVVRDWSVKDVLAHLAEWEAMGLEWVSASRRGENPPCPAPGFTWRQTDGPGGLNDAIYQRYRDCPVEDVLAMFRDAHRRFRDMVASLSEEELGDSGHFAWTEGAPFFRWVNGFAAHDLWAKTKIRRFLRVE